MPTPLRPSTLQPPHPKLQAAPPSTATPSSAAPNPKLQLEPMLHALPLPTSSQPCRQSPSTPNRLSRSNPQHSNTQPLSPTSSSSSSSSSSFATQKSSNKKTLQHLAPPSSSKTRNPSSSPFFFLCTPRLHSSLLRASPSPPCSQLLSNFSFDLHANPKPKPHGRTLQLRPPCHRRTPLPSSMAKLHVCVHPLQQPSPRPPSSSSSSSSDSTPSSFDRAPVQPLSPSLPPTSLRPSLLLMSRHHQTP